MSKNLIEVDFFYSMRSPWSYISTYQVQEISIKYNIKFNIRFVYPIALRIKGFFERIDPLFAPYLLRDASRVAEMKNIPYRWPSPDPIVMEMPNKNSNKELKSPKIDNNQPYIYRITRLGVLAGLYNKDLEYVCNVAKLIWDGKTKDWDQGNHINNILSNIGLNAEKMNAEIITRKDEIEKIISNNQILHRDTGHWGVPVFGFNNEPFFGQDRLDVLLWRLKKNGLEER
jgi:2-hydroxychromene-2-carboxylate isomerase